MNINHLLRLGAKISTQEDIKLIFAEVAMRPRTQKQLAASIKSYHKSQATKNNKQLAESICKQIEDERLATVISNVITSWKK